MSTDWPVNFKNCDANVELFQEQWHAFSSILTARAGNPLKSIDPFSLTLATYRRTYARRRGFSWGKSLSHSLPILNRAVLFWQDLRHPSTPRAHAPCYHNSGRSQKGSFSGRGLAEFRINEARLDIIKDQSQAGSARAVTLTRRVAK